MALQQKIPYSTSQIKATMSFHGPVKRWKEVHAHPGVYPAVTLQSAMVLGVSLANTRWNCLASDCFLDSIEMSVFTGNRKTWLYTWPTGGQGGPPTNGAENAGNDCLRLFMHSSKGPTKSIYLGGIPDSIINNDGYQGEAEGNTTWYAYLQQYLGQLLPPNGWGFMGNANQFNGAPRKKIITIASTAIDPGTVIVTTAAPLGLPDFGSSLVRIGRVPGATQALPINQIWQTINPVGSAFQLLRVGNQVPPTTAVNLAGGFAQIMVRTFFPYGYLQGISVSTRRRGNSGGPKGRSKFKRTIGY
jgi:hypothetical protein